MTRCWSYVDDELWSRRNGTINSVSSAPQAPFYRHPYRTYRAAYDAARGLFFATTWEFE
jgi:hypothetical protein